MIFNQRSGHIFPSHFGEGTGTSGSKMRAALAAPPQWHRSPAQGSIRDQRQPPPPPVHTADRLPGPSCAAAGLGSFAKLLSKAGKLLLRAGATAFRINVAIWFFSIINCSLLRVYFSKRMKNEIQKKKQSI